MRERRRTKKEQDGRGNKKGQERRKKSTEPMKKKQKNEEEKIKDDKPSYLTVDDMRDEITQIGSMQLPKELIVVGLVLKEVTHDANWDKKTKNE
mmetsp:Transcript_141/g.290  ORF Transcript_141/g.290 Transcript_141/m.290 type:complete len:94 (+) Transcript_141:105-386(+)